MGVGVGGGGGHDPVRVVEGDVRGADLLVRLEGNVPVDHVVQEDAQGPDGGGVAVVAPEQDPLRRRVHAGAWDRGGEKKREKISLWQLCLSFKTKSIAIKFCCGVVPSPPPHPDRTNHPPD